MTATAFSERRQLAHRISDGIDVTLFWSKRSDQITIAVVDSRSDDALEFEVEGSAALDAFNHPYAYAADGHDNNRGVSHLSADAPTRSTEFEIRVCPPGIDRHPTDQHRESARTPEPPPAKHQQPS